MSDPLEEANKLEVLANATDPNDHHLILAYREKAAKLREQGLKDIAEKIVNNIVDIAQEIHDMQAHLTEIEAKLPHTP